MHLLLFALTRTLSSNSHTAPIICVVRIIVKRSYCPTFPIVFPEYWFHGRGDWMFQDEDGNVEMPRSLYSPGQSWRAAGGTCGGSPLCSQLRCPGDACPWCLCERVILKSSDRERFLRETWFGFCHQLTFLSISSIYGMFFNNLVNSYDAIRSSSFLKRLNYCTVPISTNSRPSLLNLHNQTLDQGLVTDCGI